VGAEWQQVVGEMEQRRSLVSATVLVAPTHVRVLRDIFGRHLQEDGAVDDGRARVRVAAQMPRAIAEQLAGWGSLVEVLEPPEVRAELAGIAAELAAQYPEEGDDDGD
jgi:predicted DNA-binding transcriptional regulator YafY